MSANKILKILSQAIKRKKLKNSQYSLAWLARDLKVSRVFVSGIFAGSKNVPLDRLDDLIEALELDEIAKESLLNAVVDETLENLANESALLKKHLKAKQKAGALAVFEKYQEVPASKLHRLSPWYNTALLDMISLSDFKYDFQWMEARLGIPAHLLKRSWYYLLENGLIEEVSGQWRKADAKLRYPTKISHEQVREYHQALILKGLDVMNKGTTEADFENRLINGVTLTANSAELSRTKLFLQSAQYEAAEQLATGECDEVYHLAVMLYPLTTKRAK